MRNLALIISSAVVGIVLMIAVAGLSGLLLMWAWNNSVTQIFHVVEITWFQGWMLLIVASLLIKSDLSVKAKD